MKFLIHVHRIACGIAMVFGAFKMHSGYCKDSQTEKDFGLLVFILSLIILVFIEAVVKAA